MYRGYTISVVIPCLNEEDGIGYVLSRMPSFIDKIIVVDNGSTDKTSENSKNLGAIVIQESRRGYGRAYKTGISSTASDIVITMDGDASYSPNEIENLIVPIVDGEADFVSGSRFPLKDKTAMPPINRLGNSFLTWSVNILFKKNIMDSQSGMWAFWAKLYPDIAPSSDGMAFTQEIKINALLDPKIRFKEVHISYSLRLGTVKLSRFKDGIIDLSNLFKIRLRKWL